MALAKASAFRNQKELDESEKASSPEAFRVEDPLGSSAQPFPRSHYRFNWSPRRYCKYAVTNKPDRVTGISPNKIPDNRGSTIFYFKS